MRPNYLAFGILNGLHSIAIYNQYPSSIAMSFGKVVQPPNQSISIKRIEFPHN